MTVTEIARRAVALGYARSMTRQRVMQLATSDPTRPGLCRRSSGSG
ncbi:hypothetical protein AB0M44_35855 [Streptosporangium subroseum]